MPLDAYRTRIARELLGWSQERLTSFAGVTPKAVDALERTGLVRAADEQRIRSALERAGIEFSSGPDVLGPGVRLRPGRDRSAGRSRGCSERRRP
jgi:transcriptional regulator with XRE-family HTH domain